jgi:hypothetical protein
MEAHFEREPAILESFAGNGGSGTPASLAAEEIQKYFPLGVQEFALSPVAV